MLDLSPLRNALTELEAMHAYTQSAKVQGDPQLASYMRTALVKGFEYAYELSHKFMARFLDLYAPQKGDEEERGFRSLIRTAHEYGIVRTVEAWFLYREKRNITSHTYDGAKADGVASIVPNFLDEARFTLQAIERKLEANQ